MDLGAIQSQFGNLPLVKTLQGLKLDTSNQTGFGDTLNDYIKELGTTQTEFNEVTSSFLKPETTPGMNEISFPTSDGPRFVDTFSEFISDVNSVQKEAANLTDRFIKGEPVDLHEVMIAAEKSKTSFQLLMEIRNKFTDLYKEVIRMQI